MEPVMHLCCDDCWTGEIGDALPLAWQLPCPVAITVDETDKYPRLIGVELGDRPSAAVVADVVEGTPQWLAEKLRAA